jgi:methyltransferase (TIGR00027 family)
MKPGKASQTAVMVAAGRAIADGRTKVEAFSDPTAFTLLPQRAQERVAAIRSGAPAATGRERAARAFAQRRSTMMIPRTVAIDDAVRAALPRTRQLVILGAGLDGRAWRMDELSDTTVFEVDHPDSQRDKRERAASLTKKARDIRFVPVDFERDDLAASLAAAGHDPSAPTLWIWEGVVMYLGEADIDKTLAVVAARSAPGSRIVIAYHAPALIMWLVGFIVRRMGEPLRSAFTAVQMQALLARHGFTVRDDADLPALAARLTPEVARDVGRMRHLRIVVAERAG